MNNLQDEIKIKKFRENAVVLRLYKYLGQCGYAQEKISKVVFTATKKEEDFLSLSELLVELIDGTIERVDSSLLLPKINLKLKHLIKSQGERYNETLITVHSFDTYAFEPK